MTLPDASGSGHVRGLARTLSNSGIMALFPPPETALSAPDVHWLSDDAALAEACRYWATLPAIGLDTEFVRTRTFHARLGLIQVGAEDRVWFVDAPTVRDYAPFSQILAAQTPIKIIHSGSEDVEIFNRLGDETLQGFFDTQVAAALCGLGPSLSYQALVDTLCGIEIEKDVTRSDWTKRPLSDAQIRYAALDVVHLEALHSQLSERLASLERLAWVQEDCDHLVSRTPLNALLDEQYRRFKYAWKLKAAQRSALRQLLGWRENTARERDRPRNHIALDDDLLKISRELPSDKEALLALDLRHKRSIARWSRGIVATVAAAREAEPPAAPPEPLDRTHKTLIKALRDVIAEEATRLGIAPEVLCGKRELLTLLQQGRPSPRLDGWRYRRLAPLFEPLLTENAL
ncbi:MAG: ribonuclease D [Pseudomonadota bacterium]